jgi:hypothetical protein
VGTAGNTAQDKVDQELLLRLPDLA